MPAAKDINTAVDQVSFYQRVSGELDNFTPTPACHALQHFVATVVSAQVRTLVHQPEGVTVLCLYDRAAQNHVLCWSRDGSASPLLNFLDEATLGSARFYNTVGAEICRPVVVCEHPLYIKLSQAPHRFEAKSQDNEPLIHLSTAEHQSIGYTGKHWRGANMLRAEHQLSDLAMNDKLRPEAITQLAEGAVLRDTRNRVWNVEDPRALTPCITIKLNRAKGFKRISYRFMASKGRRHWNNACEMLRRGVSTPLPVAFHERPHRSGVKDSYYLCEFVENAFCVRDVYRELRAGNESFKGLDKAAWFDLLASFVCNMHNRQIVHKDLSSGNLLLHQTDDGTIHPMLIDIGRAWLGAGTRLAQRHRLQDIIRIAYKLNWHDRENFIAAYEAHMGHALPQLWRLPFRYYDAKQALKRRLKGKKPKPGPR